MEWKRSCPKHAVGSEGGSEVCTAGKGGRGGERNGERRGEEREGGSPGLTWRTGSQSRRVPSVSLLPATIQAPGASGGDSEVAAPTFVPERGSLGTSREEAAQ